MSKKTLGLEQYHKLTLHLVCWSHNLSIFALAAKLQQPPRAASSGIVPDKRPGLCDFTIWPGVCLWRWCWIFPMVNPLAIRFLLQVPVVLAWPFKNIYFSQPSWPKFVEICWCVWNPHFFRFGSFCHPSQLNDVLRRQGIRATNGGSAFARFGARLSPLINGMALNVTLWLFNVAMGNDPFING